MESREGGKKQQRGWKELKKGGKMSPAVREEKIRTCSTNRGIYNSAVEW